MFCWGWRCILVRIRGNNLEQSKKIRVLNIPGELLDTKMIWFVYCLLRCAALQITLDSAWTLQGLSYIEGWVQWYFNDRMWKTTKPGWSRDRFAGRAMQATLSCFRTELEQVTFTGITCTSSASRGSHQRHSLLCQMPQGSQLQAVLETRQCAMTVTWLLSTVCWIQHSAAAS